MQKIASLRRYSKLSEEITEYDPASGICVVRDHYKLDSGGYLEVEKKSEKKEGATQHPHGV